MLYGFRVHSIQNVIFRSSKLKEISAGSVLVDELPTKRFSEFLSLCGIDNLQILQAAAGVLTCQGSREAIETVVAYWPITVERVAPGMAFTQATLDVETVTNTALSDLIQKLEFARQKPKLQENHTPLSRLDMLTGNAAVKSQKNQGDSAARDRLFQRLHGIERRFEDKIDSLAQKIHPH